MTSNRGINIAHPNLQNLDPVAHRRLTEMHWTFQSHFEPATHPQYSYPAGPLGPARAANPAPPQSQPLHNRAVLGLPGAYTAFDASIKTEADQMSISICGHWRANLPVYLGQILEHWLKHNVRQAVWTDDQKKAVVARTLIMFEPLYIYSARALGNQLHAIPAVVNLPVVGQAFLFHGLLPGAPSGFAANPGAGLVAVGNNQVAFNRMVAVETQYISFLQPFYELVAYAAMTINPGAYNFAANAPPYGIPNAANVNQMQNYICLETTACDGKAAHHPLPGPGGAPGRRELQHVKLCPTRKDNGLQFHTFNLDTIQQLFTNLSPAALAANGGIPMMYFDPRPGGGPTPTANRVRGLPAAQRTSLLFQFFNHTKLRQLRYNAVTDVYTFRNRGINMSIERPRIITDGEQTYLGFLVTHPNALTGRQRIPMEEELRQVSPLNNPGFHDEFRVAQNPDHHGGDLLLQSRRPIVTSGRVVQLPTGGDRPIIEVDFGQRNHICAVYGDRSDVAATQRALFVLGVPPPARGPIRAAMREPVKIVRGRHFREKSGTAWFERKHKAYIAQAVANHTALVLQFVGGGAAADAPAPPRHNLQEMIDNLRGRRDALHGGTVRSICDYYNIFYQQVDEVRVHFNGRLFQRTRLSRNMQTQHALSTVARYILDPMGTNANNVSKLQRMRSVNLLRIPANAAPGTLNNRAGRRSIIPPVIPAPPAWGPAPVVAPRPLLFVGQAKFKWQKGHGSVPTATMMREFAIQNGIGVYSPERGTSDHCQESVVGYEQLAAPANQAPAAIAALLANFNASAHQTAPAIVQSTWCSYHQTKKRLRCSNKRSLGNQFVQQAPALAANPFRPGHVIEGIGPHRGGHRRKLYCFDDNTGAVYRTFAPAPNGCPRRRLHAPQSKRLKRCNQPPGARCQGLPHAQAGGAMATTTLKVDRDPAAGGAFRYIGFQYVYGRGARPPWNVQPGWAYVPPPAARWV
ncbi:hypothetical protein HDU88_005121 [Geranomyces variabilis]|nr:hypothetical protein HDU88_005121 [Geranomyces variabilis]